MEQDAVRAREVLRRRALVGHLDKKKADKPGSLLGRVGVLGVAEEWPGSPGRLMAPVCQINLLEFPFRPADLEDLAFLCLYMDIDADGYRLPNSSPNGEGWEVRAYRRDQPLAEIADQAVEAPLQSAGIQFTALDEDFPDWDDASDLLVRAGIDKDHDWYAANVGRAAEGIKVGGWPSLIQSEIFWAPWNRHPANPSFVLQIDSVRELDLYWGDQGVLYLGRGDAEHRDEWALEWQCM